MGDQRPSGWTMFGGALAILIHAGLSFEGTAFLALLLGAALGSMIWIGLFMGSQPAQSGEKK